MATRCLREEILNFYEVVLQYCSNQTGTSSICLEFYPELYMGFLLTRDLRLCICLPISISSKR